ncbi:hypothetical protein [Polaromonas jejuensis]|uniref:Uncharacterized protein n=1 Tax=Polaromonas jejuensis TaxID=457502 RepID=A0ABW0Q5M3_9BURK|nr:hypothetical protein [Polaromonas jejuensis]
MMVYFILIGLTWGAWRISRLGYFESGDDIGYWLGVAGGVMMLLLFSYPLRKHFRFAQGWGRVKWWFWVHMGFGVFGPLLILLHSTFQARSLNAAVALYSMVLVALSGVVGRFLYARVNRGLHGERTSLHDLEVSAGLHQREASSLLRFAPAVAQRLKAFADGEISVRPNALTCLRRVFWLPVKQWLTYRACMADIRPPLRGMAKTAGWEPRNLAKRERLAGKLVRRHLTSVVRVAQYTAYERLVSLWHVAHIPFVYLLVISVIVHVVAVHAY